VLVAHDAGGLLASSTRDGRSRFFAGTWKKKEGEKASRESREGKAEAGSRG